MRHLRFQKGVSWLAIVGLLMRVGLGVVFAPMLAAAADASDRNALSSSFSSKTDGLRTIVICTGSGLKKITIDADGNPVDGGKIPDECPLCTALTGLAVAVPVQLVDMPLPALSASSYEIIADSSLQEEACRRVRNRSPPIKI